MDIWITPVLSFCIFWLNIGRFRPKWEVHDLSPLKMSPYCDDYWVYAVGENALSKFLLLMHCTRSISLTAKCSGLYHLLFKSTGINILLARLLLPRWIQSTYKVPLKAFHTSPQVIIITKTPLLALSRGTLHTCILDNRCGAKCVQSVRMWG